MGSGTGVFSQPSAVADIGEEPTIPSGNTDNNSDEETSNTGSESVDNTEQTESE